MANVGNQTSDFVTCYSGVKEKRFYINKNNAINLISISVVNSATSLSGVLLNVSFIITVLKNKSLKTIPNIILIGLALNDLFIASVVMPMIIYVYANLVIGKILCPLFLTTLAFLYTSGSVSYALIVAISIEKYLATIYPFWYDLHMSKARVGGFTIGLTIGVLLETALWHALGKTAINNIIQVMILFISHAVFLFCQVRVIMVVRKVKQRIASEQTASRDNNDLVKKKNKAYSLLYIALSFMLCYLPITLFAFYSVANGYDQATYQYLFPWLYTLVFLSPTLSPLVYYWRLKEVRNEAKKIFFRAGDDEVNVTR